MQDQTDMETEETVRAYLPGDPALYSVFMPGTIATAVIQRTRLDPVRTFDQIIEWDEISDACVNYLLAHDAPVFDQADAQCIYVNAFEEQLSTGLAPSAARLAALRHLRTGAASTKLAFSVVRGDAGLRTA